METKIKATFELIEKLYQENKGSYSRQDIIEIVRITTLQDISAKLNKLNDLSDISGRINGIWGEMRDIY